VALRYLSMMSGVSDDSVRKLGNGVGVWTLGRKGGSSGFRMNMWSGLKDVAHNFVVILLIRTLLLESGS
jgi:hypothetical protein